MQGDYEKGESVLLHAVKIYETIYGADDYRMVIPLTTLCDVYDRWGKSDKAQSCHARVGTLAPPQQ